MPIYEMPGDEKFARTPLANIPGFVLNVAQEYRHDLVEVGLAIDILLAFPKKDDDGEPTEDALKLHGYACLATIQNRSPKLRAQGLGDVLLTIDAHRWLDLDSAQQTALIHHELTHIELSVNDSGVAKLDDYGRPKTKMRLHDRQFGWFDCVAEAHPMSSMEVQQAADLMKIDELRQTYFPGFSDAQLAKPSKESK